MSRPSTGRWIVIAIPPVAASLLVLRIAGVGRTVWTVQLAAIALAGMLALALNAAWRGRPSPSLAPGLAISSVAALALPLLRATHGPARWVAIAGARLYVAPLVLPASIAACAVLLSRRGWAERLALALMTLVALVAALQPDAAQGVAWLAASSALLIGDRRWSTSRLAVLVAMTALTGWSLTRPDPLLPVPYVEAVFATAFQHSLLAGVCVVACAVAFVASLARQSSATVRWPLAVAGYYGVCFAGSVAGVTPAPLVGYGAAPLLGFGVLAGVARVLSTIDPAPAIPASPP